MEFARIAGAQVIAMDINDARLDFCKAQLGVHHTVNPLTQNALDQLKSITNNDMPTVIIDATGSLQAIQNAFPYLAHGGRYVLVGLQKGDISFSHPEFHKREATLMSSRNANKVDFDHVIANPPYYPRGGTPSPVAARATALQIETPLGDWVQAATRRLAPGGWLTLICGADGLPEVLAAIIRQFSLRRSQIGGSFDELLSAVRLRCVLTGNRVSLTTSNGLQTGIIEGIAPGGELLLRTENGLERLIQADEIRLLAP